jgi:serine/threonine protein kinase
VSDQYVAKICDMGLARIVDSTGAQTTNIGDKHYMPPEFSSGKYTQKLDVFTFGLTLNELYNGSHKTEKGLQVIKTKAPVLYEKYIEECIASDPDKRPTSKEIKQSLKNFIQQLKPSITREYKNSDTKRKNEIFAQVYRSLAQG